MKTRATSRRRGAFKIISDKTSWGRWGLGLNTITWWNSLYIDAAVKKLEAGGLGISPEIRARLPPLVFEHINFHGFYPFNRPELGGGLRDLRDPNTTDEQE